MKTFEISYKLLQEDTGGSDSYSSKVFSSYIYRTTVQANDINMAQRVVQGQNGGPDKCQIGNIREV